MRGLNAPAAQHVGTGRLHGPGSLQDLLLAFHGARSGHDYRALPGSNLDSGNLDNGVFRMEIARDQLVGLRDVDNFLDPGKGEHRGIIHISLVAENPDGSPLASRDGCRGKPHPFHRLDNCFDLFLSRIMVHDDKHEILHMGHAGLMSADTAGDCIVKKVP